MIFLASSYSAELTRKSSRERGGGKIAWALARSIAGKYPFSTRWFRICTPPPPTFGALPSEDQSFVRVYSVDFGKLFATTVEITNSTQRCKPQVIARAVAKEVASRVCGGR